MIYRLRSYDISPPGGYFYEQTEGVHRVFRPQPIIEPVAKALSSFRKGNGLSRSDIRECVEDVDHFVAARVDDGYRVATEDTTSIAMAANNPTIAPPCRGCGAVIE